jgi:copper oxidase (laccase) domain-containing protein
MYNFTFTEDDFTIQILYNNYKIIFTKKTAGNFSFQQKYFDLKVTSKARFNFAKRYDISPFQIHNPILEHDNKYYIAEKPLDIEFYKPHSQLGVGDVILVLNKNIYGMITFADCIPLVLINLEKEACAAIHLGSRSIVNEVTPYLIKEWKINFNLNPDCWLAIIGPSIFYKDYEIQSDFIDFIEQNNNELLKFNYHIDEKYFFDNRAALIYQLNNIGIEKIIKLDFNTYSDKRFSSYRKDKPNHITQALFVSFS